MKAKAVTAKKPGAREIVMRKVADLIAYERNPRTHSEFQIKQIADSISKFGFTNPILLDGKNNILAGHGRVAAAQSLNMKEIPCVDLKGLSKAEQRAYVIADNQLALAAGWDLAILADEIQNIAQSGFDVTLLGFSEAEMANIESLGARMDEEQWTGMPEFDQPNAMAFRSVIVHFKTQDDVDAFAKLIDQKITDGLKFVWYPAEQPFPAKDFRYATADSEP